MSLTKPQLDMIDTGGSISFRNKIIGGDFSLNPWQRGTSFAAATNAYNADRWLLSSATSAVVTISKLVDGPTVAEAGMFTQHCYSVAVTTADASIAAGDFFIIGQPIEGNNSYQFGFGQAGTRKITLSFWVKSSLTGIYCVSFRNSTPNRSYIAEYTILAANTWEKKIITISVDTTGTWLYSNDLGIFVNFSLATGSTFQTTANSWQAGNFVSTSGQVNFLGTIGNTFKIALVQLEAGSVATPFEQRSVSQELQLCQRYYEKSYNINVYPATVTNAGMAVIRRTVAETESFFSIEYKIQKRTSPTVTYYNPTTGASSSLRNLTASADITVTSIGSTSSESKLGEALHASGGAAGNIVAGHWTAEAEL